MVLPTGGCPAAAADAVAGAVAGGLLLLLPPPQRGLRGALTGQKASLGCTLSEVASQASVCASVQLHGICTIEEASCNYIQA